MKTSRPYIRAQITPKAEKAVKRGHPWVYGEEITSLSGTPDNGDIVDVFAGNSWQGSGFYNSNSKITIRRIRRILLEAPRSVCDKLQEDRNAGR